MDKKSIEYIDQAEKDINKARNMAQTLDSKCSFVREIRTDLFNAKDQLNKAVRRLEIDDEEKE